MGDFTLKAFLSYASKNSIERSHVGNDDKRTKNSSSMIDMKSRLEFVDSEFTLNDFRRKEKVQLIHSPFGHYNLVFDFLSNAPRSYIMQRIGLFIQSEKRLRGFDSVKKFES